MATDQDTALAEAAADMASAIGSLADAVSRLADGIAAALLRLPGPQPSSSRPHMGLSRPGSVRGSTGAPGGARATEEDDDWYQRTGHR